MHQRKKKSLTLIEIMVVIALIGIIGGVLGVNMKKSMDKAKAFKATAHCHKVEDVLNLYYAEQSMSPDRILTIAKDILWESGLFKEQNDVLKDPYGNELVVGFEQGGFTCKIDLTKKP